MSLKRIIRLSCFGLLIFLLAWYSVEIVRIEANESLLLSVWDNYFSKFDANCIHWIGMRIGIWIYIFLLMMRLESNFTVYLYIKKRNYNILFFRMYAKCLGSALFYFGGVMIIMGMYFGLHIPGQNALYMLLEPKIITILIRECMDCLNFCLIAYFVYCCTKQTEISFLITLAGRLLLGFVMKGQYIEAVPEVIANIVLVGIVLVFAAHNFAERIKGES